MPPTAAPDSGAAPGSVVASSLPERSAPSGYLVVVPTGADHGVDPIGELARALRRSWSWLLTGVVAGIAAAGALVVVMTPVYRAETRLMSPADSGGGGLLSRLPSGVAGLASLAGIGGGESDLQKQALARLDSFEFTADFVRAHRLLPVLFRRDAEDARSAAAGAPTLQDAVKKFDEDVRKVHVDEESGVVYLRIYWSDPALAADWANALVDDLNEQMRRAAIDDARRAVSALQREVQQTGQSEIRDGIYDLIQAQLQQIAIASARPQYAFRVVDRAVAPDRDKYVRPAPLLYLLLGGFGGLVLGAAAALLRRPARTRSPA